MVKSATADAAPSATTAASTKPVSSSESPSAKPASSASHPDSTESPKAAAETSRSTESAPPEAAAPVKYDFKLPDGVKVEEGYLNGRRDLASQLGLTAEQAQGLVDADFSAKAALRAQWQAQIKSDPELAGDLTTKVAQGRAAIARIMDGGGELLDVLDQTGLGDYPPFMKFITKLGAKMGEPRSAETSDAKAPRDPLRTMFNHADSQKLFKDTKGK